MPVKLGTRDSTIYLPTHLRTDEQLQGQLGQFYQLAEDLIPRLQFLHSHLVAYCNIKLDNLVYSPEFGLQIIDFDMVV